MVPEFAMKDLPLGRTLMMMMMFIEVLLFSFPYVDNNVLNIVMVCVLSCTPTLKINSGLYNKTSCLMLL